MLWDSEPLSDSCEICACSRMIKTSFNLNERCTPGRKYAEHSCMDKENIGSPLKNETDISFYANTSPARVHSCHSPSPPRCVHSLSEMGCTRPPLEDFDPNSQDSGYGQSYQDKLQPETFFKFTQPYGTAPRRNSESPKDSNHSFSHHSSVSSMDDEFMELIDLEDDSVQMPSSNRFNDLIKGSLETHTVELEQIVMARPALRRSLSLNNEKRTPVSSRARHCLFQDIAECKENYELKSFKRPEPPSEIGSGCAKRTRTEIAEERIDIKPKLLLQRSFSATDESIMYSVERSSSDPSLIGDFSKPFTLPLVPGRHQDLKSISPTTLALLMKGEFSSQIASFKVIDCRYPYEFNGGHVEGALNLYTKEQIQELVESKCGVASVEPEGPKRHILIFHCEFSSERGPNLSRFLRKLDRTHNVSAYPALHYPEIYLLDGGYKNFFENHKDLCYPISYMPMLHPAHKNDLRHFHAKSKTWNADTRTSVRSNIRSSGLKRLDFL